MTLVWRPGFAYDTDASAYIDAVEAADGQALETATRYAINDFVLGCKQDGIWSAIKASCILSGARTLAGALVSLAGTTPPTNVNFVSGDYNRKTGLVGDGSTKYLDSNRADNADPQNSSHLSIWITTVNPGAHFIGIDSSPRTRIGNNGNHFYNSRSANTQIRTGSLGNRLLGLSRSSESGYVILENRSLVAITDSSLTPSSANHYVFALNNSGSPVNYTSSRLAFYSIGESLNLALLDNRVSTLIAQFGAVIP